MKILRFFLILTLLLFGLFSVQAAGKVFFVAPNGLATNNGSQASPWDLQTALNFRPTIVGPGDTIYLRGGTYKGNFTSFLVGAPGMPITVRSYPGEWAIIDANQPLNLATPIGTGGGKFTFAGNVNLPNTIVVMVDSERIQLTNRVGNSYTINARGWDGTQVSSHQAGAPVRAVSEILTINGSDVVFGSFEVTDSKVERILTVPGSNAVDFNRRFTGINVYAPRSKVINTVVHDTGQGIGFWSQAVDSELYGNISYNNGEQAPDRGHGHGIYTQNSVSYKNVEDNITFGNFGGFGMQIYGSSSAQLRGYTVTGNINFGNLYLVGGNAPADDIRLDSNFLYGSGLTLGYGNPYNGSISVTNNYVYATTPAEIQWWQKVTLTGNRFYQNGSTQGVDCVLTLPAGQFNLSQYQINNNNYIFGKTFLDRPFAIRSSSVNYYDITGWQKLGYDLNSVWRGATSTSTALVKATGVDIFYRPNKYEKGSGNIVIYNYDKVPAVTLDLSKAGLTVGQKFEIRNGANFKAAPIFAGIYSGQPITVTLQGLVVAQPTGNTTVRNPEVSPVFSVLVVRRLP